MKKILLLIVFVVVTTAIFAQDFKTDIANARSNYTAGKLSDTHFNLQQAMQELDIIVGKEVLKILPAKIDTLASNTGSDNVSTATGFIGTTIHRGYGNSFAKRADIDIITNSPLIATINSFLSMPIMGGMMGGSNSKSISVQGYKGRLEKNTGTQGQTDYTIQIPVNTTLITFSVTNSTDTEILNLVNTIPLPQIAALLK
jgi:hypothetical protein